MSDCEGRSRGDRKRAQQDKEQRGHGAGSSGLMIDYLQATMEFTSFHP